MQGERFRRETETLFNDITKGVCTGRGAGLRPRAFTRPYCHFLGRAELSGGPIHIGMLLGRHGTEEDTFRLLNCSAPDGAGEGYNIFVRNRMSYDPATGLYTASSVRMLTCTGVEFETFHVPAREGLPTIGNVAIEGAYREVQGAYYFYPNAG